jgi:hypothetical protein
MSGKAARTLHFMELSSSLGTTATLEGVNGRSCTCRHAKSEAQLPSRHDSDAGVKNMKRIRGRASIRNGVDPRRRVKGGHDSNLWSPCRSHRAGKF